MASRQDQNLRNCLKCIPSSRTGLSTLMILLMLFFLFRGLEIWCGDLGLLIYPGVEFTFTLDTVKRFYFNCKANLEQIGLLFFMRSFQFEIESK